MKIIESDGIYFRVDDDGIARGAIQTSDGVQRVETKMRGGESNAILQEMP